MRQSMACVVALGALVVVAGHADAAFIPSDAFVNPTLINFDSVPTNLILSPANPNPFAGQGVLFTGFVTAVNGQGPFTPPNELRSGFATNLPFIVRADFSVPVLRVGADAYSAFGGSLTMTIFDSSGAVIEAQTVTPGPPFTAPIFLGLESPSAPIARVEFQQNGSTLTSFPGIDNFRFQVVPEPRSLGLLGLGLAGIGGHAWRRRHACRDLGV